MPPAKKSTATLGSINHENKGSQVYELISAALIEGRLKPYERIRIRELAEEIGVSVTPVRDAVLRLVQDGALIMRSPRDIRVNQISLEEYLEIRDIRLELEGMAAARAAENASEADIKRLLQLIYENEIALNNNDLTSAIGLNQRFHFEYCQSAKMPILLDILRKLWLKMGPLIAEVYKEGGRDMIDGHYDLINAMKNRDGQAARIAVQNDILSGGQVILQLKKRQAAQSNHS